MSRLYGAKVDEKKWKVEKIDNGEDNYDSYKLIDLKSKNEYFFRHIIGLEQVSEDEFLINRRVNHDDFEIARYELKESVFVEVFFQKYNCFYFITGDRIMFTYWGKTGPYRCRGVYSIKDNSMLEEAEWLRNSVVEIYKDDENLSIYVEKEIPSCKLGDQKIIFTIDPNTLQPNSNCYSQVSDSFIKVSSKEDIYEIQSRDQKNIALIEEQMIQQEKEKIQKAKQKILVR